MLRALITPLTMYQLDDTLFEDMELPKRPFTDRGYDDLFLTGWDLDSDVLINNLLMETAELNVLYTDPNFLKSAITVWSKKELPVWQLMYETLFFQYNPIWNKDGTFKRTAKETRALTSGFTRSVSRSGEQTDTTSEGTDATTTRTPNLTDETELKVSAFDSTTYQNKELSTTDRTGTETTVYDEDVTGSLVRATEDTEEIEDSGSDSGTIDNAITETEYGNIGVTMTQQLIEAERKLVEFNIYDYIIESFKKRFCVLVY